MEPASGGERQGPDGPASVAGSTCLYCGAAFDTVPDLLTHERSCPLLEEAMTPTARRRPLARAPLRTATPPAVRPTPPSVHHPGRARLAASGRALVVLWTQLRLLLRATGDLGRQLRVEGTASVRGTAGRWALHGALAGAVASVLVLTVVTVLAART